VCVRGYTGRSYDQCMGLWKGDKVPDHATSCGEGGGMRGLHPGHRRPFWQHTEWHWINQPSCILINSVNNKTVSGINELIYATVQNIIWNADCHSDYQKYSAFFMEPKGSSPYSQNKRTSTRKQRTTKVTPWHRFILETLIFTQSWNSPPSM